MPQSISKNYVHLIWSTKHRMPLIQPEIKESLYSYLKKNSLDLESPIKIIGGIEDHIHIFTRLSPKIALMTYVQKLKTYSSGWIKGKYGAVYNNFYWQNGYGAFSVNPSDMEKLIYYIENQEHHHKNRSFKQEYLLLLKKYQVDYEEQYLWE